MDKPFDSEKRVTMKLQSFNDKTVSQAQCRGEPNTANTLSHFRLSLIALRKYTSCHQVLKEAPN